MRAVLASRARIEAIVLKEGEENEKRFGSVLAKACSRGIEVRRVGRRRASRYFDTVHSQGIGLVVVRPKEVSAAEVMREDGPVLVLDGVSDPGNCGSLIRTAVLLGFAGVIRTPGTVDFFSPKVVRSSVGAVVYLPIATADPKEVQNEAHRSGRRVLTAVPGGKPFPRDAGDGPGEFPVLVLGGEARGVGPNWADAESISIPVRSVPEIDSLGVAAAGAILMAWIGRKSYSRIPRVPRVRGEGRGQREKETKNGAAGGI
ncbi:MAG: RNA methyltransferase [Candidatus Hydrogenedentota bacterium]|nr:MAG: RNA methyltransferase [Candidatus Hydrogenedentota bacterium]